MQDAGDGAKGVVDEFARVQSGARCDGPVGVGGVGVPAEVEFYKRVTDRGGIRPRVMGWDRWGARGLSGAVMASGGGPSGGQPAQPG